MAGYDLAFAKTMSTEYQNALTAALKSQSYTILNRTLVRADLKEIQKGVEFWNSECIRLSKGNKLTVCRVIPRVE